MKYSILIFTISLLFLSCKKTEEKKSFWDDFYKTPYIISEKNKLYTHYYDSLTLREEKYHDSLELLGYKRFEISYPGPFPPYPLSYSNELYGSGYGNFNIIINKNKIYFHLIPQYIGCGTNTIQLTSYDEIYFLDIDTDKIQEITNVSEISTKIKNCKKEVLDSTRFVVTISSLTDTITNPYFNTLLDSVRNINLRFTVRRITEEEHHVLDAKTRNIPYDPKNYKWTMKYLWLPFNN